MVTVLYYWSETQDAYGDEEEYVGQNVINKGIKEKEFKILDQAEEFIGDLSVAEGESEGHEHYRILAVYDKETAWYDMKYVK